MNHAKETRSYGEDNDGWFVAVADEQRGYALSESDAVRFVACVNACAGMNDPATDIAALRAEVERMKSAAVPAGWHMVPVKPTREMLDALRTGSRKDWPSNELCSVRYCAMLAAAPTPPVAQADEAKDAARYRWLRAEHGVVKPLAHVVWKVHGDRNGYKWANTINGARLDAAIDAAMKDAK